MKMLCEYVIRYTVELTRCKYHTYAHTWEISTVQCDNADKRPSTTAKAGQLVPRLEDCSSATTFRRACTATTDYSTNFLLWSQSSVMLVNKTVCRDTKLLELTGARANFGQTKTLCIQTAKSCHYEDRKRHPNRAAAPDSVLSSSATCNCKTKKYIYHSHISILFSVPPRTLRTSFRPPLFDVFCASSSLLEMLLPFRYLRSRNSTESRSVVFLKSGSTSLR